MSLMMLSISRSTVKIVIVQRFDHEDLHKVHTKEVLCLPNKDLCVQSVVLLQSILDYVKCSTSSVTYCLVFYR